MIFEGGWVQKLHFDLDWGGGGGDTRCVSESLVGAGDFHYLEKLEWDPGRGPGGSQLLRGLFGYGWEDSRAQRW